MIRDRQGVGSPIVFEHDLIFCEGEGEGAAEIPAHAFKWLESQCLAQSASGKPRWLALTQKHGRRAVQVGSFVGVLRGPGGLQIEILPKLGRAVGADEARAALIGMLRCLHGFTHVVADEAMLAAARMPLLEVFMHALLMEVRHVVKRGLRSAYVLRRENLPTVKGKIAIGEQLRRNVGRADRFFTDHDEWLGDRPENRLLRLALRRVRETSRRADSQRLARELEGAFSDVPLSLDPLSDLRRMRIERGMSYYEKAISWARLLLTGNAPITGAGNNLSPSLLFPMEKLFEAFVAKHLRRQLAPSFSLHVKPQAYLARHRGAGWFRLEPDLMIKQDKFRALVLDTKWKLIDAARNDRSAKYNLVESDFYQMLAYGHRHLGGTGTVVLIYPKSDAFQSPLGEFALSAAGGLDILVVPFCLRSKRLIMPDHPARRCFLDPAGAPKPT